MKKKTASAKKPIAITVWSIGAVVVILLLVAGLLGYVTVRVSTTPHVASASVCGDKDIESYNIAYGEQSKDKMTQVLSSIDKKSRADNDPTCVFMRAQGYQVLEEKDKAIKATDSLKKQVDHGDFVSPRITSLTGIDELDSAARTDDGMISGYE